MKMIYLTFWMEYQNVLSKEHLEKNNKNNSMEIMIIPTSKMSKDNKNTVIKCKMSNIMMMRKQMKMSNNNTMVNNTRWMNRIRIQKILTNNKANHMTNKMVNNNNNKKAINNKKMIMTMKLTK